MDLPNHYDIRFSELADLPCLNQWFSHPDACDEYPWNLEEAEDALKNWIGFSRYRASLTAVLGTTPCAIGTLYLMPYRKVAHHSAFYLMVDPAYRRKGIGTSMVRNLLHLAKTRFRFECLHAEIFEPAPIQPILEKLGFVLAVRQENFIKTGGRPRARLLLEHFFS